MTDWTPVVIAVAAVLYAVAAAVPTVVVIWQHQTTRSVVKDNSQAIGRVEANTNGTLEAARATAISLRAEVVGHEARLAALEGRARHQRREDGEQPS